MTAEMPLVRLLCAGPDGAHDPARWNQALGPELEVRPATWKDPRPGRGPHLAVVGVGDAGAAEALCLAVRLQTAAAGPVHLFVEGAAAPAGGGVPLLCPVTLFSAVAEEADLRWAGHTAGAFTVRIRWPEPQLPLGGPPSAEVALALKEELHVWPH